MVYEVRTPRIIYISDPSPYTTRKLVEQLDEEKFTINDIGVSSRVFTHWRSNGLIPDIEDGSWVKLNEFQFIWVQIIKDLRAFNFSLKQIVKVRGSLFEPLDGFATSDLFDKNGKTTKVLREQLKKMFDNHQEIIEGLESGFESDPTSMENFLKMVHIPLFLSLSLNVLFHAMDHTLLIRPDGCVDYTSETQDETLANYLSQHDAESVLVLPLKKYILMLVSTKKLEDKVGKLALVTPVEMQVLQATRQGRLSELRIIFDPNNQHTDLVYTYKGVVPENEMSTVLDRFRHKKHVQLFMKTNDGKTVSFEYQDRKRVHKLNGN
ncbi:MAG: hypothetical protein ACI9UJ_001532 [bacterium]